MSSTGKEAEREARDACADLFDPDRVRVRVKVSWLGKICIPDENGETEEVAEFRTMTYGDNAVIEKVTTRKVEIGKRPDGKAVFESAQDLNEYRRLLVKRNLVSWTLGIPIERDQSGWMTPESYAQVSCVSAPLLTAFVSGFEDSFSISSEEEEKISRQCSILFSKNSRGVADACDAIGLFCNLGNFAEKFGINREDLIRVPYLDYLRLKIVMSRESESLKAQTKASQPQAPGRRGKPEVRIPL